MIVLLTAASFSTILTSHLTIKARLSLPHAPSYLCSLPLLIDWAVSQTG
jgi:hypothetical protein